MRLHGVGEPLRCDDVATPSALDGELIVRVEACGVCRTDLHLVDGDIHPPRLPVVPGHEVVGEIVESRASDSDLKVGDRVGIPWLASTCGDCVYCREGKENLCRDARFTGFSRDGGFAEFTAVDARYAFAIPETYSSLAAAPLLCAGLIGYRSYRMAGDPRRVGLYGFGAAAHIVIQLARAEGREVYAFTRPGDDRGQEFARTLGASWAGGSLETPPEPLDAAIIYAPVGALVPQALRVVRPGGTVVCAGIYMSEIPAFDYALLWEERRLLSVANLTRADGWEFFDRVGRTPVTTHVSEFPLDEANTALRALREGELSGAAVLTPASRG